MQNHLFSYLFFFFHMHEDVKKKNFKQMHLHLPPYHNLLFIIVIAYITYS